MMTCPYCGSEAKLTDSGKIYSRSYGWAWVCARYPQCDSYVGCHPGTAEPLGRLADATLRKAKQEAHTAFDPLWKGRVARDRCSKKQARNSAYRWLAKQLGISKDDCHIGQFDVETCRRVVEICK